MSKRSSSNSLVVIVVIVVVVVSHIQHIGCQPEKTTLHGGQSRSWSAEQGKKRGKKNLAAQPPPPPPPPPPRAARSEKKQKQKNKHATHPHAQALRRSRSVSRLYKYSFDSSARPMGVASQDSTLPCAITTFPVSLPLSSPGDV